MGQLIEHAGNGDIDHVQLGEGGHVDLKLYQAIYHQVTGRTEQIRQRYSDDLLVDFAEIEQLHIKIQQLCEIHKVVASNEVISVFYERERKDQFTSFDSFRKFSSNTSRPTINVVLKYNFSIIPADVDLTQEYVVTIRLNSRVAMLQQLEKDAPPFVTGRFLGLVSLTTAEVTIDYVNYVIARGFLEAFDEWIIGCKKTPPVIWLRQLRKYSEYIPSALKFFVAILISWFAFNAIPAYFDVYNKPEIWARFFVVYAGGALILVPLMGSVGNLIEEAIDSYPVISYLKLNRGDINLIEDFGSRKKAVLRKLLLSSVLTIFLSIVSAKLEKFI